MEVPSTALDVAPPASEDESKPWRDGPPPSGCIVLTANVAETADDTWRALAATLDPARPDIVSRFGRLCYFGRDDETAALGLRDHDVDTLRDRLSRHVNVVSIRELQKSRDWKYVRPDRDVLQAILKRPVDALDEIAAVPRVDRVVDVPVYGADGTVMTEPGYHPSARTFYDGEPFEGLTTHWDDLGARAADVEAARQFLLEELLGDFPFADQASKAHALGLVVEQFARGMVDGPTPMYAVMAPEQGTGKSLLAQAALYPACGRLDLHPEPDEHDSDFQKRLLSILIAAPRAVVFDNVTRTLESSTLAAMLTTGRYTDRVLGRSALVSYPVRHTTVATMNAGSLGPDMRRRVVPIYIESGQERPWERVGPAPGRTWRHPNLLRWATENRQRLAWAALTLVENYARGWEDVDYMGEEFTNRAQPSRLLGSFEQWSTVVGGIVTAAGVHGFGDNLDRLYSEQSDADDELADFLAEWPDARLTADQIRRWVTVGLSDGGLILPTVDPPDILRDRRGQVNAQTVGNGLRKEKGKVRRGRRLCRDGSRRWYVENV